MRQTHTHTHTAITIIILDIVKAVVAAVYGSIDDDSGVDAYSGIGAFGALRCA